MSRRNLILLHRGRDYENDFREIAEKVHAIDPTITVVYAFAGLKANIPDSEWRFPTLTVAMCETFELPIKRGPVLRNFPINKFDQQEILRKARIPTPMAMPFQFGMRLDPILFGEHVILKPLDPRLGSHGLGIRVLRRARAEQTTPDDFEEDHPIRRTRKGYIVQKFVYTGEFPRTYRVTTFMGAPIYAATYTSNEASPPLDATDAILESGLFTQKIDRSIKFEMPDEFLGKAREVANAFDHIPLLGIDFVRDARTGQVYVLEVNAGGNTWHFSSRMWAEKRKANPNLVTEMKQQYAAFDVAAQALVDGVNRLAA